MGPIRCLFFPLFGEVGVNVAMYRGRCWLILALVCAGWLGTPQLSAQMNFTRGDCNADGTRDVTDVIAMVEYLFEPGMVEQNIANNTLPDTGSHIVDDAEERQVA